MAETVCSRKCFLLVLFMFTFSKCEGSCIFPGTPSNSQTDSFKATYSPGEILRYSCFNPYEVVGKANLTCLGDKWDADVPECVKACPPVTFADTQTIVSKNVTLEDVNIIGDVLVLGCKDGYMLDSGQEDEETVIICQLDGWRTESVITCSKISCPDPGIPIGVERDGESFLFDDVVSYSCSNENDVISSGSTSRTCLANGTWSGSTPVCTAAVDCIDPGVNSNTIRLGDNVFTYAAVVTYECHENAVQVSGSESITCQLDGTWSDEPLMCQYPTTPLLTTTEYISTTTIMEDSFTTSAIPYTVLSTPVATDSDESTLSKGIIYVAALVGGSLIFVFLIGSAICIFTSKPRRQRRKSKNEVQKTDWVHKSAEATEPEPLYEPPPNFYHKESVPLKPEPTGLLAKSDSVRSEASYLTPDDLISHEYQNVPEVLTRL